MTEQPSADRSDFELTHWGQVARRRKRLVLTCVVLALALAALGLVRSGTNYAARATVALGTPVEEGPAAGPDADEEADLAVGRAFTEQVLAGLPEGVVLTAEPRGSRALLFEAVAGDPDTAVAAVTAHAKAYVDARLATARAQYDASAESLAQAMAAVDAQLGQALPAERALLEAQRNAYGQTRQQLLVRRELAVGAGPRVIEPPARPSGAESRPVLAHALIALTAGLVVGLALAAVVDARDDRVRDRATLAAAARRAPRPPAVHAVPTLRRRGAAVAGDEPAPDPVLAASGSSAGDWYAQLRLELDGLGQGSTVLQVTSCVEDDGALEVSYNLAAAFARSGHRAAVLRLDGRGTPLRSPGVQMGPVRTTVSSTRALLEGVPVEHALAATGEQPRLFVIEDDGQRAPVDAFGTAGADTFFEDLRTHVDVVVVLTRPVLPYPEPLAVSRHADAVVLVARAGVTRRRDLVRAMDALTAVGSRVGALVLVQSAGRRGHDDPPAPRRDGEEEPYEQAAGDQPHARAGRQLTAA